MKDLTVQVSSKSRISRGMLTLTLFSAITTTACTNSVEPRKVAAPDIAQIERQRGQDQLQCLLQSKSYEREACHRSSWVKHADAMAPYHAILEARKLIQEKGHDCGVITALKVTPTNDKLNITCEHQTYELFPKKGAWNINVL